MRDSEALRRVAQAVGLSLLEAARNHPQGRSGMALTKLYVEYCRALSPSGQQILRKFLQYKRSQSAEYAWLDAILEDVPMLAERQLAPTAPVGRLPTTPADPEPPRLDALDIDTDVNEADTQKLEVVAATIEDGDADEITELLFDKSLLAQELSQQMPALRGFQSKTVAAIADKLYAARKEAENLNPDGISPTGLAIYPANEHTTFVCFKGRHGEVVGPVMELRTAWGEAGWALRRRADRPKISRRTHPA